MEIKIHPCWNNNTFFYADTDGHFDVYFLGITLLTLECERSVLSHKKYPVCSCMDAMCIYKIANFFDRKHV